MHQSHYADTRTNGAAFVPFADVLAPLTFVGEGVYLVIAAAAHAVGEGYRRVRPPKATQASTASD